MSERRTLGPDVVLAVLGLVAGAWTGALFTLAHRSALLLALGLFVVAALLTGLRLVSTRRFPAIAAGVGVIGAIALLAQRGPGGSVVVQDDVLGWSWLIGAASVAAVALAWPRLGTGQGPLAPSAGMPKSSNARYDDPRAG